uniref:Uncharacterized protein TCIL3000_4_4290 n=1 Tax=Trypanosoma congolense (strain IL3000) TaxID=1068625 RepID=G0ULQ9_TRYCI|nr:unnamed protein product [Trypanosoma congolense IL3000]
MLTASSPSSRRACRAYSFVKMCAFCSDGKTSFVCVGHSFSRWKCGARVEELLGRYIFSVPCVCVCVLFHLQVCLPQTSLPPTRRLERYQFIVCDSISVTAMRSQWFYFGFVFGKSANHLCRVTVATRQKIEMRWKQHGNVSKKKNALLVLFSFCC